MKPFDPKLLRTFLYWVKERESIRKKKEAGLPRPWTKDEVLDMYRFCNVRRRDDRVSRWIVTNIIDPADNVDNTLWLQLAFARYINWPDAITSLMDAGLWPSADQPPAWESIGKYLDARVAHGEQSWTGAYMIRAESNPSAPWFSWGKGRYVAEVVVKGLYNAAPESHFHGTLEEAHAAIAGNYGWGSFMAGQLVADLAYCEQYLAAAPDLYTWAPVGPGSRRGLNRLLKKPLTQSIPQDRATPLMVFLKSIVDARLGMEFVDLSLHDIQNCLCEFDKYVRVINGEGRPRALYREQ